MQRDGNVQTLGPLAQFGDLDRTLETPVWGLSLVWWLVIGMVALGVVILLLSVLSVTRRLPRLHRAGQRLRIHAEAVDSLREAAVQLAERAEQVAAAAAAAKRGSAAREAHREVTGGVRVPVER